jgi:hypothetical protein
MKRLFLLVICGCLVATGLFSLVLTKTALAAEANPEGGNASLAITVHLSGTIPSPLTVTATISRGAGTGLQTTPYSLSKLDDNTYGINALEPFVGDGSQTCNNNDQAQDFGYTIIVKSDGTTLAKQPATLKCGNNDVTVPALTGITPTPTTQGASLSGAIYVTYNGDTESAVTPAENASNAAQNGTNPAPVLELNPGKDDLTTIGNDGSYSYSKLTAGSSYTLSGTVASSANPVGENEFSSSSFTLSPGANMKFFTIDADNNGAVTETATAPKTGQAVTPTGCTDSDQATSSCQSETVVCSATLTNPISWLVCPIVSSIQDFMNYVGSEIESYLTVPNSYFDSSNVNGGQQIYVAWDNIRNIALALLAIFALIMVFSQALSIGPFDAYTVKKLLPRILISAVLVTLSWPLISLAVGISNGVGEGLRSLIFAPFRDLGTFNLNGGDEGFSLITGLGLGAAFGIIGTLSFALTAIIALLTGLVVIVIRQLILILLAILSPIALVSYILPGTDKIWKLWWDSFFGVLIMFPLIEAFIAVGSVFAAIAAHGNNPLDKIIGFVAIYLPYFLLPATVRFAGGALRTIGGQVQGAHMGLQGGLGNFRKGQREKLRAAEKIGERWHGQSWIPGSQRLAHRADQISKGVGTGWAGHYGVGRRGGAAMHKSTVNAANEYMQSPDFAPVKDYDAALQAKTYRTAQEAEVGLRRDFGMTDQNQINNALEAARVSGGFGGIQAVAAAKALVNTGTGYANLQQMTETLARASGGNAGTATDLAGYANNYTKQVGRADLAPSFGVLNSLVQRQAGHAAGGAPTATDYDHALDQSFIQSGTLQPILAGRAPAMQAFASRQLHQLEHGNQVERRTAAINLLELQKNIQSSTGANRDIINRTMFRVRDEVGTRVGIDFNANASVADQLATIASHGPVGTAAVDFEGRPLSAATLNGMARVYSNEVPGGVQQQQQQQQQQQPPPGGGGP